MEMFFGGKAGTLGTRRMTFESAAHATFLVYASGPLWTEGADLLDQGRSKREVEKGRAAGEAYEVRASGEGRREDGKDWMARWE